MKRVLCFLIPLVMSACASRQEEMMSIQLVDRKGFSETVTSKERIKRYRENNFLSSQPYQKVVRHFKEKKAKLTSYHDNGELYQYLEVKNGRAHGVYREWYPNGKIFIESYVIEGIGDLDEKAKESFVFDGESLVFREDGSLKVSFFYDRGFLEKEAVYYFSSGEVALKEPYKGGKRDGEIKKFDKMGQIVGVICSKKGIREGKSFFLGDENIPKWEEYYDKGSLEKGEYCDFEGQVTHRVEKGNGIKPFYKEGKLFEEREYINGKEEGVVRCFDNSGALFNLYHIKEGQKEGEEVLYFPKKDPTLKKMSLEWREGMVHGLVKTFYEEGSPESEKEVYENEKHGMSFGWYLSGDLMFVEEYEKGKLIKGRYMKKGEENPTSTIEEGEGEASLFDKNGTFLRRVRYKNGKVE